MSEHGITAMRARVLRGVESRPATIDDDLAASVPASRRGIPLEVIEAAAAEGRQAGFGEGYDAGLAAAAEAVHAAQVEQAERVAAAVAALATAARAFDSRQAVALEEIEDAVAQVAFAVAEAIVGRELAVAVSPGRDALARALQFASGRGPVVARLHPEDLEAVGEVDTLLPGASVRLVADPSVGRGGCVLEEGSARIDARMEPALERVRAALVG